MRELDIHPAAELFPLLSGQEFDDLVADIGKHGQHEPIRLYQGKILDGRNRYRACETLGIEPRRVDLPADLNPWDYVWSQNAERRHLDPGTKAVCCIRQRRASADWEAQQQQRREEANRKHAEAAARQPRVEGGKFSTVGVSPDTPTASQDKEKRKHRERDDVAKEAGVSSATAGRALALDEKRPDLADKVQAGEVTLNETMRQP